MDSENVDSELSRNICSLSETLIHWYIQCHNTHQTSEVLLGNYWHMQVCTGVSQGKILGACA